MIVIDASIIAPMLIDDEPDLPEDILSRIAAGRLIAPAHWPLETANMLHVAERRRRIDRNVRDRGLQFIQHLGVTVVVEGPDRAWGPVSQLADAHRLTLYDAAYLDLAIRRTATLATIDRALVAAAIACSVEVMTYA